MFFQLTIYLCIHSLSKIKYYGWFLNHCLIHWTPMCLKIDPRLPILLANIFPFWLSLVGACLAEQNI